MKIILAPDKFKGTLTARQAAEIEKAALLGVFPEAEILTVPLADGGEGTVDTLTAALHGNFRQITVSDPLHRPVTARFGTAPGVAIVEMAAASGMALLRQEELNPLKTTTFGTGELLRALLDFDTVIVGIGGSATVDGGCGMAEALGYRFYDASGEEIHALCGGKLSRIVKIDVSGVDPRLKKGKIRIASDVTNPLLGPCGATAVFAPQKGATPEMLPVLEKGLSNLRDVLLRQGMLTMDRPGDGAAGGLGMGLRAFCFAEPESGAQLALKVTGMAGLLEGADCLITGEGRTDSQTENGKLCLETAKLCRSKKIPAILLSGYAEENPGGLFDAVFSAAENPHLSLEELRRQAEISLSRAAEKAAQYIQETIINHQQERKNQ